MTCCPPGTFPPEPWWFDYVLVAGALWLGWEAYRAREAITFLPIALFVLVVELVERARERVSGSD